MSRKRRMYIVFGISYAIHQLRSLEDLADIPLLKEFSSDKELGTSAINAIEEIELRSGTYR